MRPKFCMVRRLSSCEENFRFIHRARLARWLDALGSNNVLKLPVPRIWKEYGVATCISKHEFDAYFAGLKHAGKRAFKVTLKSGCWRVGKGRAR
jgi:hypothetical protein